MIRKFCWTSAGERPIDGSSISSRRGLDISARPIATICCSPPGQRARELVLALLEARKQGVDARRGRRRTCVPSWSTAPSSRFSRTVICPNSRRFSGTIARPLAIRWATGQRVTSSPSSMTRPERGRTSPRIVFSVVDFPDALPPSRHTSSPASTDSSTPLEDPHLAVVGRDVVELEQHQASASASGSRPRYASTTAGWLATCVERALGDLDAVVERHDAVGDPLDHVHVVLDHEDRQPELVAQPADHLGHLVRLVRVHPGGGLVEQQQPRLGRERPGDLEAAAVGVREHVRRLIPAIPRQAARRRTTAPRSASAVDLASPRGARAAAAGSTPAATPWCGRRSRP